MLIPFFYNGKSITCLLKQFLKCLFFLLFRNWVVNFCPMWLAPNLLTFVGFLCCVAHFLLPTFLDYDFTASSMNSSHPIPNIAWFFVAILLFISHTLDGKIKLFFNSLGAKFIQKHIAWQIIF